MWIWGDQVASGRDNQPASGTDNDGFSISPHYFIYTGKSLTICEKSAGYI